MNKLRAWDEELGFMVDPSYYFVSFDGSVWFNNCQDGEDELIEQTFKLKLMKYTGLEGCYEDDIVRITGEGYYSNGSFSVDEEEWEFIGRVELNSFIWVATQKDCTWFPFADLITEDNINIEIIGNIYENPELIS